MIKYIKGDLVKMSSQFDVIVHGCNCFHSMNSGIAPQIRRKFPESYKVDCDTKRGIQRKLGSFSITEHTTPIVVNAYTQFYYGRGGVHLDYNALAKAMILLDNLFHGKKIGMPKIGAGLAGGDWDIIEDIINTNINNNEVTVVLWDKNTSVA